MNVIHFIFQSPHVFIFLALFLLLIVFSVTNKKHTVAAGMSFIASYVLLCYAWVGVEGSLKVVLVWLSIMLLGLAQQLGMPTGVFSVVYRWTPVEPSPPPKKDQASLGAEVERAE